MAPRTPAQAAEEKQMSKKKKSTGGGSKKKLTAFNKYMKTEMARLREEQPDMSHQDRFKLATSNWKTADENPKKSS